jgi:hypothetical protein
MSEVVLTFAPGDPVPPWFVDVEPRDDVPAHMPRLLTAPVFVDAGCVVDEGARYVVKLDGEPRDGRVIVCELYYCMIVVEKPILWADGSFWPGRGVPPPLGWAPDPARLKRIAAASRAQETILTMSAHLTPVIPARSTYYKAAALVAAGLLIGVSIMAAVVGLVLAVAT